MVSSKSNDLEKKTQEEETLVEAEKCIKCGLCVIHCPVYTTIGSDHYPGPRHMTDIARLEKESYKQELVPYLCTLCKKCYTICPRNVSVPFIAQQIRANYFAKEETIPTNVEKMAKNIQKKKNSFGLPPEFRLDWMQFFGREAYQPKEQAEYLFFIGCLESYKAELNTVADAAMTIFEEAGIDFTILGNEEVCCGSPSLILGDRTTAKKLAEENLENFKRKKVKTVVTTCPSCFLTIKKEYPKLLGKELSIEILHITQFLMELIKRGKITFEPSKHKEIVSFMDPCELGRSSGIFEEPREVIKKITNAELVETKESKARTNCCGGGGALRVIDPGYSKAIGKKKIKEFLEVDAEKIVTSCPSCFWTLKEAGKEVAPQLVIIDLVEWVAKRLKKK
ncbi:MAG: 4Fe-4S dicluster domain-containing protein [Candidatus Heimdallarchaeota archaeon]|nr:4Fe-4S dicluster domain-containing protein [Candidatus Heimdallarchaeota archaeon]